MHKSTSAFIKNSLKSETLGSGQKRVAVHSKCYILKGVICDIISPLGVVVLRCM